MSPEQINVLTALLTLIGRIGPVPIGVAMMIVVIGPWICLYFAWSHSARHAGQQIDRTEKAIAAQNERTNEAIAAQNRRSDETAAAFRSQVDALVKTHEKRFEGVVRMYENNVQVVKDYHGLSSDLAGIITLSTRTLEGLGQKIDNNQFCPLARKGVGKE